MRRTSRWIALAVVLLLVVTVVWVTGGSARRAAPVPQPPEYLRSSAVEKLRVSHTASANKLVVWAHGSWCWFGDPRAVHIGGSRDETIVGWIGWRGQITVGAYGVRSGLLGSHVIGRLAVDDHGSPSILVEQDGRVTVFWSGHSGPRMFYRTS